MWIILAYAAVCVVFMLFVLLWRHNATVASYAANRNLKRLRKQVTFLDYGRFLERCQHSWGNGWVLAVRQPVASHHSGGLFYANL